MNKKILKKFLYLKQKLSEMETANKYAPFPVYDTEHVKKYRNKVKKMEKSIEKVECCGNCKSLFLVEDEFNNVWCGKCNSPNTIEECENIDDYLNKYGSIWT